MSPSVAAGNRTLSISVPADRDNTPVRQLVRGASSRYNAHFAHGVGSILPLYARSPNTASGKMV
jgi:hypothetical protein